MADVHILGIRHHGPGSARSVEKALNHLNPECVLIEGAPEAEPLLFLAAHTDMKPPVALLSYNPENSDQYSFFPFTEFSPEWVAIRWALARHVPIRFMDLPQCYWLNKDNFVIPQPEPTESENPKPSQEENPEVLNDSDDQLYRDPIGYLAALSGYSDSERWWEHHVELQDNPIEIFAVLQDAMQALREHVPQSGSLAEACREAQMREVLRQSSKEFERIAVVCGAWHSPVLLGGNAKEDKALLKNLKKVKVTLTWTPWSYSRLSSASGYRAGVEAPGWYEHLWRNPDHAVISWMVKVAQTLRSKDLDASSASVIEAVRLAEALTALTGRKIAGLPEITDAIKATLCFGDDALNVLLHQELIIGEKVGSVPSETPFAPLQADLAAHIKRLRLPKKETRKDVELDLRKETDLERSQLFYRLNLLGVDWAIASYTSGKGTFKEAWHLFWQPEQEIALIEAGRLGQTISRASQNAVLEKCQKAQTLPEITEILEHTLLANLPEATAAITGRVSELATESADVAHILAAIPKLVQVARYSNVRQVESDRVLQVLDGLIPKACAGLPNAVASLDDALASEMKQLLSGVQQALTTLDHASYSQEWTEALLLVSQQQGVHGLVAGKTSRILLDAQALSSEQASTHFGLGLSHPEPAQAAYWLQGFLEDSGLILIHDPRLWGVLDAWVSQLNDETFVTVLPLIRRTFSQFSPAERRQMGEQAKDANHAEKAVATVPTTWDSERVKVMLPMLHLLLGQNEKNPEQNHE